MVESNAPYKNIKHRTNQKKVWVLINTEKKHQPRVWKDWEQKTRRTKRKKEESRKRVKTLFSYFSTGSCGTCVCGYMCFWCCYFQTMAFLWAIFYSTTHIYSILGSFDMAGLFFFILISFIGRGLIEVEYTQKNSLKRRRKRRKVFAVRKWCH